MIMQQWWRRLLCRASLGNSRLQCVRSFFARVPSTCTYLPISYTCVQRASIPPASPKLTAASRTSLARSSILVSFGNRRRPWRHIDCRLRWVTRRQQPRKEMPTRTVSSQSFDDRSSFKFHVRKTERQSHFITFFPSLSLKYCFTFLACMRSVDIFNKLWTGIPSFALIDSKTTIEMCCH